MDEAEKMKDEIDVLIICGGSATDLPVQTPKYAQWFNVVDSFVHMQEFRSISKMWIKRQKKAAMWESSL